MGSENSNEHDDIRVGSAVRIITVLLALALIISLSSVVYYLFLVTSVSNLTGEATLAGTFYNSNDRRVEGVLVRVEGTGISGYTDERGDYELKGVPAGEQTIVFERGGYPTIKVTQLIIPENKLKRYDVENNRLDIPDNIVGGVLVDKPRHRYQFDENNLEEANLTARFPKNLISYNATVSLYNSTIIYQISENGEFNLTGVSPGLLLLNITFNGETAHAVALLKEGSNNITFKRELDFYVDSSLGPVNSSEELPRKEIGFRILDIDEQPFPEATIFIRPLVYNPMNMTILDNIPSYKDVLKKRILNLTENEKISIIDGHVYNMEIAVPGYVSFYFVNMTYNGTDPVKAHLETSISPVDYRYSLSWFWIVIFFQVIMSVFIGFSLKAVISRGKFGRVMTGCIAAFASSASLPLAALIMPVAHNWILGVAAFVLLLINKKKFSK